MASCKPEKKKRSGWNQGFVFGKALGEKDNPKGRLFDEKPKKKGYSLK